jgi:hypothetical protein
MKIIKIIFSEFLSYTKYSILLNDKSLDKKSKNVFFLMNSVYLGFFISFIYGFITSFVIFMLSNDIFHQYIHGFFVDFNCFINGGLLFGLAFQIYKTQDFLPNLLKNVFGEEKLRKSNIYLRHLATYYSVRSSLRISTIHIILSFLLFYFARFPYANNIAEISMILYSCSLFACGVYVGRKIFYSSLLLRSIEEIELDDDIFSEDKLGGISSYVNVVTTFTVIAVWFLINSYYKGPFRYDTQIGDSVKILMFYPAILSMPVLIIFNYYPRTLIRKLYVKSINNKINLIKKELNEKNEISEFEKIQYLCEIDKISKDELQYKLRLALNDLPLMITIVIMLLSLLLK